MAATAVLNLGNVNIAELSEDIWTKFAEASIDSPFFCRKPSCHLRFSDKIINNCKMAFGSHVVDRLSDEYKYKLYFFISFSCQTLTFIGHRQRITTGTGRKLQELKHPMR